MTILPCPFCGSESTVLAILGSGVEDWYSVSCGSCGASGELDTSKDGAAKKWNTRSSIADHDANEEAAPEGGFEFAKTLSDSIKMEVDKAVHLEHEHNCEAVCSLCNGKYPDYGEAVFVNGMWEHRKINGGEFDSCPCDAAAIRARGRRVAPGHPAVAADEDHEQPV